MSYQEVGMRRFRRFGSSLLCAAIVAATLTAFNTPVSASGGSAIPSRPTICQLLSFALQFVSRLPDSSFKTALLSEIREEMAEHGC